MRSFIFSVSLLIISFQAVASDPMVIYSGRSDKFVKPVIEAFEKQSGTKVIVHTGQSTGLLNKLKLEGARTHADLFISNDAGNLQRGSELELFDELPESITSGIPENYRASDNTWIGLSARARVLVGNTESTLAAKTQSILDLAKPEYKGKIGITQSTNGSFIAGVTVYQEKLGDKKTRQWLEGLKENAGHNVFNKHSAIVSDVAKGKLDVGLVNHYYVYRHFAQDPKAKIKIIVPDQGGDQIGVAWNVAGVALSKYSDQKEEALSLIKFLSSRSGQKLFADVNMEYPTRKSVHASDKLPSQSKLKVANVPMSKLGQRRDQTVDLIEKVGLK